MKYIVEQKKLESLLDSSVWELLAENNAIVADQIACWDGFRKVCEAVRSGESV